MISFYPLALEQNDNPKHIVTLQNEQRMFYRSLFLKGQEENIHIFLFGIYYWTNLVLFFFLISVQKILLINYTVLSVGSPDVYRTFLLPCLPLLSKISPLATNKAFCHKVFCGFILETPGKEEELVFICPCPCFHCDNMHHNHNLHCVQIKPIVCILSQDGVLCR